MSRTRLQRDSAAKNEKETQLLATTKHTNWVFFFYNCDLILPMVISSTTMPRILLIPAIKLVFFSGAASLIIHPLSPCIIRYYPGAVLSPCFSVGFI